MQITVDILKGILNNYYFRTLTINKNNWYKYILILKNVGLVVNTEKKFA